MENILGTGYQPPRCHLWQKYKLNFWRNEDHRREKVDESQFCNFLFFLSFSFFFFFFFFFLNQSRSKFGALPTKPDDTRKFKIFFPPPDIFNCWREQILEKDEKFLLPIF